MEKTSSVQDLFRQATALVQNKQPGQAQEILHDILSHDPHEVNSLRLLGSIELAGGNVDNAIGYLERAVREAPGFAQARLDLGRAYLRRKDYGDAKAVLSAHVKAHADSADAWQLLADTLMALGERREMRQAQKRAIETDPFRREIGQAIRDLGQNRRRDAEQIFRRVLSHKPDHIYALIGLATIAMDANSFDDAEKLLKHGISISENVDALWRGMARLYSHRANHDRALHAANKALELAPDNPDCWTMLGTIQAWSLNPEEARQAFERSLEIKPDQPRVFLSLGHVEKTLGHRDGAEAAYRKAIELYPGFGEAYWSLADLKTYVFSEAEVAAMESAMEDANLLPSDRAGFEFALGRAFEERQSYEPSFAHYAAGNAIKHRLEPFDLPRFEATCKRLVGTIDRDFIERRKSSASEPVTPIFIVGLPRSGSTLVEQILASHSSVQGTMELPHILNYVRELEQAGEYPDSLATLSSDDLEALGRRYLEETEVYRNDAPVFIDKMPNNFVHVGLIYMMLPHATIIDARRHPMDCCFSIFKQNFAHGQAFGYDLEVLAAYYRNYVALMSHWQKTIPSHVLTVRYEALVDNPDAEIRRLLERAGLPFDEQCLRFYETKRPVRTASAEQVRQPINRRGLDVWRSYADHLKPLAAALAREVRNYEKDISS